MNYDIKGEAFYIPDSILCAKVNGRDVHVLGVSETSLRLRMPAFAAEIETLSVIYYDFRRHIYASVDVDAFEVITEEKDFYTKKLIIVKDNKLFSDVVRDILKGYYNYIKAKSNSEGNEFSKELAGYPAEQDEEFMTDYTCWRQNILKYSTGILAHLNGMELALILDSREKCECYLEESYICPEEAELFRHASRFYLGSLWCPDKPLPEALLKAVIEKAQREQKMIMCDGGKVSFLEGMTLCDGGKVSFSEWCVNDYGELMAPAEGARCLGPLLNKRRKDPRYRYKFGFAERADLLLENQTNADVFAEFLKEHGIERYEYEACGYPIRIAGDGKGHHSLHLPLYQTNTAKLCTLKAVCRTGDRGRQQGGECSGYCENYYFSYPEHTKLIGLGNSVFGVDMDLLEHPEKLEFYRLQGIDRIVWNV